ncbi:hypothetical protein WA171_007158 [Blastocystis sp. BT1]
MQYHDICLWRRRTDVWYCTKKDIDELKKDGKLEKELIVDIHSNESILEKFLNEMKNGITHRTLYELMNDYRYLPSVIYNLVSIAEYLNSYCLKAVVDLLNAYFMSLLHFNSHENTLSSLESSFVDTAIQWCVDLLSSLTSHSSLFLYELEPCCLFGSQGTSECMYEVLKNVLRDTKETLFDGCVNKQQGEIRDDMISAINNLTSLQLSKTLSFIQWHDKVVHSILSLNNDSLIVLLAMLEELILNHFCQEISLSYQMIRFELLIHCNSLCLESWYSIIPSSLIHLLSSNCLTVTIILAICHEVDSILSHLSVNGSLISANALQQFRQLFLFLSRQPSLELLLLQMILTDGSLNLSVMRTLICIWGISWEYIPSLQTSLLWIRDTVSKENGGEIVSAALLDPKNSVSLPAHIRMNLLILLSITNHIKLPTVLSQSFSTCNLFLAYQQLLFGKERFIICQH